MDIPLGILSNLIPLAILGGAVYAIVQWRRRRDGEGQSDPGIGTGRRLYFYIVSFVALMVAANGIVQIAQYVLDVLLGAEVVSPSSVRLAVGASMAIVGFPLWLFHWIIVQRHVRDLPVETRSIVRKLYLYLVLGVALGVAMAASVDLVRWIFGSRDFSGYPWGALVVWGGVWALHWHTVTREGHSTAETLGIRRFYLYLVSLAALVMVGVGAGRIIHVILAEGYDSLFSTTVLLPSDLGLWGSSMRWAVALALVGSAVWGSHWLYFARRELGGTLRGMYLHLFGVLGGVVTMLVSLAFAIYGLLTWLMGADPGETAAVHFRFLPAALASLAIGVAVWGYHWAVARKEAESSPLESRIVQRSYAYILSAVGLGAIVVAVGTAANTILSLFGESSSLLLEDRDWWQKPVALAITLGILGLPLWGYYWTSIQRRVRERGSEEGTALTRRIFIFAVMGMGMLAVLGGGSALLFFLLRDLLGDGLSGETLREARPAMDVLVAVAIFLPYHFLVYRQDRSTEVVPAAMEKPGRTRKDVTVLVRDDARDFVRELEASLGYRVSTLSWADPEATLPEDADSLHQELAQRIGDASGVRVLLIPDRQGVRVLSYN